MKSRTKKERTREIVLAQLRLHEAEGTLPTTSRFIFYELEQQGLAKKPDPSDMRKNRRRSIGWPPGEQDIIDALISLRKEGSIAWHWLSDTNRRVASWLYATTVLDYIIDTIDDARVNLWEPGEPPLILAESSGMAGALRSVAAEHLCPVAGLGGQAGRGFLITEVALLLENNEREVFYLGDLDKCGGDIEGNAHLVLEQAVAREIAWTRIGLTAEQVNATGIKPIWKVDGRDKKGRDAWECEALGQLGCVQLLEQTLRLQLRQRGISLEGVQAREQRERESLREKLARLA